MGWLRESLKAAANFDDEPGFFKAVRDCFA